MKKNGEAEKKDIPRGWKFKIDGKQHTFIQFGRAMARVTGPNGMTKMVSNNTVLKRYDDEQLHADP